MPLLPPRPPFASGLRLPAMPLDFLGAALLARHPGLTERLQALGDVTIAVAPSDLPGSLVIELACGRLGMRLVPYLTDWAVDAVVRGPVALLVDLVEGRVDGDALFFGRALEIDGRTEVVVALRNALEDAEIDLARDLGDVFGPLAPLLRAAAGTAAIGARAVAALTRRLEDDLLAPLVRYAEGGSDLMRVLAGRHEREG